MDEAGLRAPIPFSFGRIGDNDSGMLAFNFHSSPWLLLKL